MIVSKQSSFVLHISAIQPNITIVTYLSCLGKGSAKAPNLQVPFCSRRRKSSNSCQKRHMHREEDTIRPCRNVCFFSAFRLFSSTAPYSPSSFRPETPARDSCKFPRICPRFALSQPIKIASCTYSLTLTARAGDCWLHVGRAM
jgi:hypothetical protein